MTTSRMSLAAVLAVVFVFAVLSPPRPAGAEDSVLHPGYITGTFSLPGHSTWYVVITAQAYDPAHGVNYTARTTVNLNGADTATYTLVVEGGPWEYKIDYNIEASGTIRTTRYATVAVGQTVEVDVISDAVVRGTVDFQGLTAAEFNVRVTAFNGEWGYLVPKGMPGHGYSADIRYSRWSQQSPYVSEFRVPAFGGAPRYRIEIISVNFNNYVNCQGTRVFVEDFSLAEREDRSVALSRPLGFVNVNLNIVGAQWVSGSFTGTTGSLLSTAYGPGTFPMVVSDAIVMGGAVTTDVQSFTLPAQTVSVAAGQVTQVHWTLTADAVGAIAGTFDVTGLEGETGSLFFSQPGAGGRDLLVSSGFYRQERLRTGTWQVICDVRDTSHPPGVSRLGTYRFPHAQAEVTGGADTIVDFTFPASYLSARLFAPETEAATSLYEARLAYVTPTYPAGGYCGLICSGASLGTAEYLPKALMAPGSWTIRNADAYFHPVYAGHTGTSRLQFTEQSSGLTYTQPFVEVGPGENVVHHYDYRPAKVTCRLRVATGALLSSPRVSGSVFRTLDGQNPMFTRSASGETSATNVAEGIVILYVLPGVYRLTAEATVGASRTTFGPPFEVRVESGDEVIIDPDGPVIALSEPPAGFVGTSSALTVRGTVTDATGVASVLVNGELVSLDPQTGAFEVTLTGLTPGANAVTVVATDTCTPANQTILTRTIQIMDGTAPVLTVTGPAEGTTVSPAGVTVTGTVTDDFGVAGLTVDGIPVTWDPGTGEFSCVLTGLSQGPCEILVEAMDGAGNVTTVVRTVTVGDEEAPVVEILSPLPGTTTTDRTVLVTGQVTDVSPITGVFVNGAEYEVDADGMFCFEWSGLLPGENTLTVTAVDAYGNEGTGGVVVLVSNQAPKAQITLYGDAQREATGPEGALFSFDALCSSDPDGDVLSYSWLVDGKPVAEGSALDVMIRADLETHVVTLVAADAYGGRSESSLTVQTVDTTPPEVGEVTVAPGALWPVNHKMQQVSIAFEVWDLVDPDVTCRIVGVTSSEEADVPGAGQTALDWEYSGDPGDLTLQLRAERSGTGSGRLYTVTVECVDEWGNMTLLLVEVPVDHDRGQAKVTKISSSVEYEVLTQPAPAPLPAGPVAPAGPASATGDGTAVDAPTTTGDGTAVEGSTGSAEPDTETGGTTSEAPSSEETGGDDESTTTTPPPSSGPLDSPEGSVGDQPGATEGGTEPAGGDTPDGPESPIEGNFGEE